jgi:hypothetical protein
MFQAFIWFGRNLQENEKKHSAACQQTAVHNKDHKSRSIYKTIYLITLMKNQLSTRMSKQVPEPGVMLPGCTDARRMKWKRATCCLGEIGVAWSIMGVFSLQLKTLHPISSNV